MILLSANTEEQILYLLPVVITDPSCTIWSCKSFGSNYTLRGLKVGEMGGACNWLIRDLFTFLPSTLTLCNQTATATHTQHSTGLLCIYF